MLPLCKIKKGDTDIEIGGFEPQMGDFEKKAQNTIQNHFLRVLRMRIMRKNIIFQTYMRSFY